MARNVLGAFVVATLLFGCSSEEPADTAAPGKKPEQGPPANAVGGFSIQLEAVTLQPGDEITPCTLFPLELVGPSRFVGGAMLETEKGLHHGNITTRPKTGEGIRPCDQETVDGGSEAFDIVQGGAVLFGSSTQLEGEEWRHFPNDMAYRVKDDFEIVARMHYLNATSEVLEVSPRYEWFTIPEADVTEELAPMFWAINDFELPPKSETTLTADCQFYEPMKIVEAMPHMHQLGTHFGARIVGGPNDGQIFLDQKGYDPDGAIRSFDPPVDLTGSEGVSFSCTWNNTFDKTIVEGIGDDEMCMLFGYAFPPENAFSVFATPHGHCTEVLPPDPKKP